MQGSSPSGCPRSCPTATVPATKDEEQALPVAPSPPPFVAQWIYCVHGPIGQPSFPLPLQVEPWKPNAPSLGGLYCVDLPVHHFSLVHPLSGGGIGLRKFPCLVLILLPLISNTSLDPSLRRFLRRHCSVQFLPSPCMSALLFLPVLQPSPRGEHMKSKASCCTMPWTG